MQFLNRFRKTESLSHRGFFYRLWDRRNNSDKIRVRNYIHAFYMYICHIYIHAMYVYMHTNIYVYIALYSYRLYILYKFYGCILCNYSLHVYKNDSPEILTIYRPKKQGNKV